MSKEAGKPQSRLKAVIGDEEALADRVADICLSDVSERNPPLGAQTEAPGHMNEIEDALFLQILSNTGRCAELAIGYQIVFGALCVLQEPLPVKALVPLLSADGVSAAEVEQVLNVLRPLIKGQDDQEVPVLLVDPSLRGFLTERAPSPYRIDLELSHSRLLRSLLLVIQNQLIHLNVPGLGYTEGDWGIFDIPDIPPLTRQDVSIELWYSSLVTLFDDVVISKSRPLLELTGSLGSCHTAIDLIKRTASIADLSASNTPHEDKLQGLRRVAQALHMISSCLEENLRIEEATAAAREAEVIYRRITTWTQDPDVLEEFALALRLLSRCLSEGGRYPDCLKLSTEALDITKTLALTNPERFSQTHATLLRNYSYALGKHDKHATAVEFSQQSVAIIRQLATTDPVKYSVDLASTLYSLAYHYDSCKKYEEALPPITQSIELYRQWEQSTPPSLESQRPNRLSSLANAICSQAIYLANLKREEESIKLSKQAIAVWREILETSPRLAKFEADLARTLHNLADDLHRCSRTYDAIEAIEESISIRRQLVARPGTLELYMADSLHNYAMYLADFRRMDEAITMGLEAISIRRRYLAIYKSEGAIPTNPLILEADLARSLHNIADDYHTWQQYDDAIASVEEAICIRREIVARNPTDPEAAASLAFSLHNCSVYRLSKDASAYEKCIEAASEAAEIRRKLAENEPVGYDASYAYSLYTIAYYYELWQRYDAAIPVVLKSVEQYRRMVDRAVASNAPSDAYRYRLDLAHALRRHTWYLCAIGQYEQAAEPSRASREAFQMIPHYNVDDDISHDWNLLAILERVRKRRAQNNPQVEKPSEQINYVKSDSNTEQG
ncbi:hypothetical protein FA15DRAFT_442878 [Coprinopsis marcescibilis]|uniref:TPR-like protein n=1 Tax=Coprinopsis marcescibilis TaxID=230819 RepID=A0A5C3KTF6_COPMA|nr:hypothetical protein FA15DRAFT_442878 [Coprinopsis marcescibilis]